MTNKINNVTGVILSGGRATRMNSPERVNSPDNNNIDKGLVLLNGKSLISYIVEALAPQVSDIIINANRNIEHYKQFNYRVVPDQNNDYMGPLSGMLAALNACNTEYIATVPCDTPHLSRTLIERMFAHISDSTLKPCVAHDGNRLQPLFSLMHKDLVNKLQRFLEQGERKAEIWFNNQNSVVVDFSDQLESFININTIKDLTVFEKNLMQNN